MCWSGTDALTLSVPTSISVTLAPEMAYSGFYVHPDGAATSRPPSSAGCHSDHCICVAVCLVVEESMVSEAFCVTVSADGAEMLAVAADSVLVDSTSTCFGVWAVVDGAT